MTDFFDNIGWSPSIGDPTFMGWFTVFAYFFCAFQSYRVVKSGDRIFSSAGHKESILWVSILCVLIFLGINKQLDLQTFFTATARYLATKHDWYGNRRELQMAFIVITSLVGIIATVALVTSYIKVIRRHLAAIIGICVLVVFVLIRATSFHYMDLFIGSRFFGLYLNWILELGGILLISLNARTLYRERRPLIDIRDMLGPKPHTGKHSNT